MLVTRLIRLSAPWKAQLIDGNNPNKGRYFSNQSKEQAVFRATQLRQNKINKEHLLFKSNVAKFNLGGIEPNRILALTLAQKDLTELVENDSLVNSYAQNMDLFCRTFDDPDTAFRQLSERLHQTMGSISRNLPESKDGFSYVISLNDEDEGIAESEKNKIVVNIYNKWGDVKGCQLQTQIRLVFDVENLGNEGKSLIPVSVESFAKSCIAKNFGIYFAGTLDLQGLENEILKFNSAKAATGIMAQIWEWFLLLIGSSDPLINELKINHIPKFKRLAYEQNIETPNTDNSLAQAKRHEFKVRQKNIELQRRGLSRLAVEPQPQSQHTITKNHTSYLQQSQLPARPLPGKERKSVEPVMTSVQVITEHLLDSTRAQIEHVTVTTSQSGLNAWQNNISNKTVKVEPIAKVIKSAVQPTAVSGERKAKNQRINSDGHTSLQEQITGSAPLKRKQVPPKQPMTAPPKSQVTTDSVAPTRQTSSGRRPLKSPPSSGAMTPSWSSGTRTPASGMQTPKGDQKTRHLEPGSLHGILQELTPLHSRSVAEKMKIFEASSQGIPQQKKETHRK